MGWGGVGCDNVGPDCGLPHCHADHGMGTVGVSKYEFQNHGGVSQYEFQNHGGVSKYNCVVSQYKFQNTTV